MSLRTIGLIAANGFRQTMRQRLYLNVVVFGVGMILLSMVVGNITYGETSRVVRSIGLSGIVITVDLMALLLAVGMIYEEIDRKTLFVILARPVSRTSYVFGRALGLALSLSVALIGYSVVFAIAILLSHGEPSGRDLIALAMVFPEATILAGFGLLLSAFSTPTLSAGIGFGFWIAAATTDDLVRLSATSEESTKAIAKAVYYVLPSLARLNFREIAVYQLPIDFASVMGAGAYGFGYALLLVTAAAIVLSRREMV